MPDKYQCFLSSKVSLPVQIKILKLEGNIESNEERSHVFGDLSRNLFVTCAIFSNGKPLSGDTRTTFSISGQRWDQWLHLSVTYQQLPVDSQIVLTVWDVDGPRNKVPIGGTTLSLFGKKRTLRNGKQHLFVWRGVEGDGYLPSRTPGKFGRMTEQQKLDKLLKKYERDQIPKIGWLDDLALKRISETQKNRKSSNDLLLCVELPTFEYPVLFHEPEYEYNSHYQEKAKNEVVFPKDRCMDSEILVKNATQNPIDNKFLKLAVNRTVDTYLRPNPSERDKIEKILNYPVTRLLSVEDKDVLWKFRFYLTANKRALTKFVRCVDWNNAKESKHAIDLINQWHPVDTTDALELLSKSFTNSAIRDYAVCRLENASNTELKHYLLQLVQALQYEPNQYESKLERFLVQRALPDPAMRNLLYWFLKVESEDPKLNKFYGTKFKQFKDDLHNQSGMALCEFQFHEDLIQQISKMYQELRSMSDSVNKTAKFSEMLMPAGAFHFLTKFPEPMALPVDPENPVLGIIPDKVKVFTSSMEPLGIRFRMLKGGECNIIFKCGDDLRQDQLIIQLISLMDNLLKKENLDLKLSPYQVVATSRCDGMVECVPNSHTIAWILRNYKKDILNYFRQHNPNPSAPNGIDPGVINTFVRSCAGYCVITFILCAGDRHLDNLLITTTGNLLHVDFGCIGRDPKPYPPPMKLCSEMVAAMGGKDSKQFGLFQQLCVEAYNILRKNANLILNLVSLMSDANIQDIAKPSTLEQIQERFQLDRTDQEAGSTLQKLMEESVKALFPKISDAIHEWKQYWDNRNAKIK